MKRKNHNRSPKWKHFRLPKEVSENIPQGLFSSLAQLPIFGGKYEKSSYSESTDDLDRYLESPPLVSSKALIAEYSAHYQLRSLLKKYPFPGDELERRNTAIRSFLTAENICRESNYRLRRESLSDTDPLFDVRRRAKDIIARVLGPLDVLSMVDRARPGPGLTHDNRLRTSKETTLFFKYTDDVSCTRAASFFTKGMISRDERWLTTQYLKHESDLCIGLDHLNRDRYVLNSCTYTVPGNRITFVPKNSKTDRTIAIEPSGNVMLQLGVGTHIKDRLRSYGINLYDQSKNQQFAQMGSQNWEDPDCFCTIDFAMASDTLCIEAVRDLLPSDWFAYLSDLRSSTGSIKINNVERQITYEKFSSMGNGYTFELESLIFFALAFASMKVLGFRGRPHKHLTVFGDDVVLRKPYLRLAKQAYEYYGFSINMEKSFYSGPFRESCGSDYLHGVFIRPFLLKRRVRTLEDLHFVCNSFMFWCLKQKSQIFWSAYHYLFKLIPSDLLCPGPLKFTLLENQNRRFSEGRYVDLKDDITNDLEACLRVPLSWAQEHGYYRLGFDTHALGYREIKVRPVSYQADSKDPVAFNGSYHTFLQGVKNGDVVLRGVSKKRLRWSYCSDWNGNIDTRSILHYSPVV